MKSIAFVAATLLCTADALQPSRIMHPRQAKPAQATVEPAKPAQLNVLTSQGCWSSKGDLVLNGTSIRQSKGFCVDFCVELAKPVAAMSGGNQCWCGDSYPPVDSSVDIEKCNVPCIGYALEFCGGVKFWSVFNTGITLDVDHSEPDEAKASGTGTVTQPKPTQTVIDPPKQTTAVIDDEAPPKEKKTNTAGIAAGVVVAVVVVVAVAVGAWMYIRKKKNREIEEEHRRNAAVSSFMGKAPSSSGTSITDARLDPVMAQRRMSDGSIADNQDYSRRILRVTNA